MAAALVDEEINNDDFYALLNVRREATQDELKAAYRRLCMLYHPDKHRDPDLKQQAETLFNLVHQAYEVLSDPQSRAIYDIYGKKGLDMEGWELVERKKAAVEIREEFERLQREREERRLQQRTNPKLEFGAGDIQGPLFGLKIFRNLTSQSFITTHCGLQFSSRGIRPGLTTVLARNLDKNTMGYLQWRWGSQSAMNTSLVRDTKTSHLTIAMQLGIPHSFVLMSYQYKFQDDDQTRIKGTIKTGFFGTLVEYGAERKISRHSILGATVSIGVPQGVSLKIKLNRASQTYFFPIHLTDQLLPSAIFYATVGPLVVYFAMHQLIIKPYLQLQKEKELEKQRENSSSAVAVKKQEAEAAVRLMQESVRRIIEIEESKLGFYDPCVGEEKSLKVIYLFRGVLHQVMTADNESLRIPKQSHRVDTDG
ncbi:hypothetical protein scyTo_0003233 [Scyliorhinus torazame]|uniref:DnaJ homolog subfamily C member 11 n=1 Tax=Scyliorhinus torazame TaxID=75743 RepID=A0A401PLY3_SCYTO|nr:hypothetical protein [Scyliorhinus torazame]